MKKLSKIGSKETMETWHPGHPKKETILLDGK